MSQVAEQACLRHLRLQRHRESGAELWSPFICPHQAQAHTAYPKGRRGYSWNQRLNCFPLQSGLSHTHCPETA